MRIESLKEDFWNLPFILAGKFAGSFSRKLTHPLGGYVPYPQVVSFYLTEKCNLKCKMCFLQHIKPKLEFIPLPLAKRVVRELNCLRPRYSMSGGEPFLYPDIEELIRFIKSRGLSLSIVTNGTLLSLFAEMIVYTGVDRLKISIDGPPDVHDAIRGVPGAFSRVIDGIKAINLQKKKQGKRKPMLFLYSLLNPLTEPDFIISFAEGNNFEVLNFLHILSINPSDLRKFSDIFGVEPHYWKGAVFDNEDYRVSGDLIRKIKTCDTKLVIKFTPDLHPSDLNSYYDKDEKYLAKFRGNCSSPWSSAYITPPSIVEICPNFAIGDISRRRFLSVWNSKQARSFRNHIFSGDIPPVCKGCCSYYIR